MKNFLGILGGMGPLATADFLKKLAENTMAECDQQHIPVIVYGDCETPDRTNYLIGQGISPLKKLLKGIHFLNAAGARAICIPCNTAHHWYGELAAASAAPIIHVAEASVAELKRRRPDAKIIGIMSTLGTHRTGIYTDTLLKNQLSIITPSENEFANLMMPGIAAIKANKLTEAELLFEEIANILLFRGADSIILGCTEIPIGMKNSLRTKPHVFIDSTNALAKSAINIFTASTVIP
jgi:aspartate racemase